MTEQKQAQIMQINMKNGINVQIGVKDLEEFKAKNIAQLNTLAIFLNCILL